MGSRIAMWAGAGFLVAGCWVLFVFATHPNTNEWMRYVWPIAFVTCPITAVGSRFPVSLYQVLAACYIRSARSDCRTNAAAISDSTLTQEQATT